MEVSRRTSAMAKQAGAAATSPTKKSLAKRVPPSTQKRRKAKQQGEQAEQLAVLATITPETSESSAKSYHRPVAQKPAQPSTTKKTPQELKPAKVPSASSSSSTPPSHKTREESKPVKSKMIKTEANLESQQPSKDFRLSVASEPQKESFVSKLTNKLSTLVMGKPKASDRRRKLKPAVPKKAKSKDVNETQTKSKQASGSSLEPPKSPKVPGTTLNENELLRKVLQRMREEAKKQKETDTADFMKKHTIATEETKESSKDVETKETTSSPASQPRKSLTELRKKKPGISESPAPSKKIVATKKKKQMPEQSPASKKPVASASPKVSASKSLSELKKKRKSTNISESPAPSKKSLATKKKKQMSEQSPNSKKSAASASPAVVKKTVAVKKKKQQQAVQQPKSNK